MASSGVEHLRFDFADCGGEMRRTIFRDPDETIVAYSASEVVLAIRAVDAARKNGFYVAGYVSYEAAPAFDSALRVFPVATMPLLWFGIFKGPSEPQVQVGSDFRISDWNPSVDRETYDQKIESIHAAIARGDTYQVNYTLRLRAEFEGDDFAFYERLRAGQASSYCAYLNTGRYRILSASPELFFRQTGNTITTKPMKGTIRRGRWSAEDDSLYDRLKASEKDRAENVMIVDLIRNDLGRIAELGSVQVSDLFEIERYRTVFQATSTVTATLAKQASLAEVFGALFPSGSVTGAPKVSTMELIARFEDSPRNAYCGAIGFAGPGDEAVFSVAIRTVVVDSQTGAAEYGVGGGVTWESTAEGEYTEALNKAALLAEDWPRLDLLETLRLEDGTFTLANSHIDRLVSSARYFGVPLSVAAVRAAMGEYALGHSTGIHRVRMLVSPEGAIRIESQPLEWAVRETVAVSISSSPVSREDRFLYHKTTHRSVYDAGRAGAAHVFDVLLWNEQGELTEFTTGNLVLELDGKLVTPPIESGLLNGTLRADLLKRGEIVEGVLTREDLERCSRFWLINSVRGWVPVHLEES
jgi:para-aminobenzoate synthetase/4-amino-4-deoxychorismate lyase